MRADAVMITQAVDEDDAVLGFTPGWVNALAENVGKLSVFALKVGECSLRDNVSLHVLGKGKIRRLWRLRKGLKSDLKALEVGAIVAHMCPKYAVAARRIVGGRSPIVLWYAHSAKSVWLRWAHRISRVVLTPTVESCPIRSGKIRVVGHGIDTRKFSPSSRARRDRLVLLTAGRITPVKRYEFLIEAVAEAAKSFGGERLLLRILGSPCLPKDERYSLRLREFVRGKRLEGIVEFRPAVPYSGIQGEYADCDVFVNTTIRHSFDKAPLEAMASARVVLTANRHYRSVLGIHAELLVADDRDPADLAKKIIALGQMPESEREKLGLALREIVIRDHGLVRLMKKVAGIIAELPKG